jgi:predicted metalloendopeptidase
MVWLSSIQLDKYHQGFIKVLTNNSGAAFWENMVNIRKQANEVMFNMLSQPTDRSYFLFSPAFVNAWYQPWRNSSM